MARVLIVDYCADLREILAMILGTWSHEVETAADSEEALAKLAAFRPHVVTTAVDLPGMNGLYLARTIRERGGPETFIICLTGYADEDTRRRALDAGCDRFLTKPVDLALLESAVADGCARIAAAASS